MGGRWVHRMTSKDLEAGTGVCATCGPVSLARVGQGGTCANSERASRIRGGGSRAAHGLTVAEARDWREGKVCEVCGTTEKLHTDHDHQTKQLRGVLCLRHNVGLGMFHDSEEELAAAIEYLRRYR